jgi:chemotaxis protein MotB
MPVPKPDKVEAVIKRVWRRKGDDDGHGGAWKVAFADFCLALLCLFLVMWLMSVRQQEAMQDLLKAPGGRRFDEGRGVMAESIGSPRGSLISHELSLSDGDGETARPIADSRDSSPNTETQTQPARTHVESRQELLDLAAIVARLAEETGLASNLQWVVTPYGLRVMLHDTDKQGMFEIGNSQPTGRFRELLRRMGPLFDRIDNQMLIVGHTDSRQYPEKGPTAKSNWMLSSERAMAARTYLVEGGMPTHSVLQVVGLADGSPLNPTDTAAAENRRIELLILTTVQAKAISAMYGAPRAVEPLIDGVDTSIPDRETVAALRGQVGAGAR